MVNEELVRQALPKLGAEGHARAMGSANVVVEEDWIGVRLAERELTLEQAAALQARLVDEFPGNAVEIQVGGFVYRGAAGTD